MTYVNSSFFTLFLLFVALKRLWTSGGSIRGAFEGEAPPPAYVPIGAEEEQDLAKPSDEEESQATSRSPQARLLVDDHLTNAGTQEAGSTDRLNLRETLWLSLEFFGLWFLANYFIAACLEYTTVASSTILSSTSGIFTLAFGAALKVEAFTIRKLVGVLASLAGIIMISMVDLTRNTDKNRGSFPHKSNGQLAIGDLLALASALLYGIYTIMMKKRIGNESRVDMLLFFGFVGVFNLIILLPGFPILHYSGIETFELPPTKRIMAIVLINSATSFVSDLCWAYSIMLTSPLITTVGLSLSIPLSLFGQMIINGQTSGVLYWIGACVVLLSFVFINYESKEREPGQHPEGDKSEEGIQGRMRTFFTSAWDRIRGQRE